MFDLSKYSCDKCKREGSWHCKRCWHTVNKKPTHFKTKKKTGVQIPELRKPTPPPPPPTSGSNAVKPSCNCGHQPTYTSTQNPPDTFSSLLKVTSLQILPNDISTITYVCPYETPCGYCTKWEKKCDKKIGGYPTVDPTDKTPKSHAQKTIDYIKSGKGLPPLGFNDNFGLQTINERKPRK